MRLPHAYKRHSRGFTLIEVLIAIGIISVLATIAVVGFGAMTRQSKQRLTSQLLSNANGWLAEYARATQLKNISTDAVPAPGKVEVGSADRNGTVVGSTRKMMQLLRTIPLNKNAMDQTPAENMIAGATSTESPILADAWNNPIIFVPADGLTGVTTSSGTSTIQSPDRKPFFASAGPDGNFTTGKDNIYSFDK